MSTSLGETIAFGTVAIAILGAGLGTAFAKRTFHAVMFLGVVLVAVGALYILLEAPLIGVLQILVYVGGILTLFVFAVMFVAGDETEREEMPTPDASFARKALFAILALVTLGLYGMLAMDHGLDMVAAYVGGLLAKLVVLLIFLAAAFAISKLDWQKRTGTVLVLLLAPLLLGAIGKTAGLDGKVEGLGDSDAQLDALVAAMFGPQVIALEVLGILLTAAMIGALVIARPVGQRSDTEHYPKVSAEELSRTQQTADAGAEK